jgi:DNA polymerase-1
MVQGRAADFLKRGMIRCDRLCRESGLDAHVIMTLHDEIIFEIAKKDARRSFIQSLAHEMADNEGHFGIPTPVEIEKVSSNWASKSKVRWARGNIYAHNQPKGS